MSFTNMKSFNPYPVDLVFYQHTSVAMKIENGPKTNTKILWFLKMD